MSRNTLTKKSQSKSQELCIDLPGETVQCWRSADHVKVILRKHRDIFFDINIAPGATYSIESASDYYSPREKKLFRTSHFRDGEQFHLWVGRNFKGKLLLKSEGKIIGTFEPNKVDLNDYGSDPEIKPEPLMIVLGKKELPSTYRCKIGDPYGISEASDFSKPMFDPKLSVLKNYGTVFDYHFPFQSLEVKEYVAVAEASPKEIQLQVLKQLDSGLAIEGSITEIFSPPKDYADESGLYRAIAGSVAYVAGNEVLNANSVKETAGYLQENWRMLDKAMMRVRIEKRAVGKYRVVFKGRTLASSVARLFGAASSGRVVTKSMPLGSHGSAFLDGGFEKSGRGGLGGTKRLMLTMSENFRGGAKIQAIGTIIDLIGDANTVYVDEKGSKDLSEFLARAGVSLLKAAASAAIGSAVAALIMAGSAAIFATGAPVILVAGLVVAGYFLAATLVDKVDNDFSVKDSIAGWAR